MGLFSSKKTTTTKEEIPEWLEAGSQQAVALGQEIGNQQYRPFTDQRVATLSGNERQASELARSGSDSSRDYLDQAGQTISELQRFDEADVSGYMNPYTESVLQPQLREANRAYEQQRTSLLNSKAGAWGGDRAAFQESELYRQHGELVTDVTAKAHSDAFDRATQLWSQDQDRQLRAADALRAVGNDVSKLNREQIQDLMATGGVERLLSQANLDFDYQQFTENRDWSIRNLQPLLASLQVPHTKTTTQTSKSSGGAFGQILGAAATVAGGYFTGGGSLAGMFGGGGGVADQLVTLDNGYTFTNRAPSLNP